MQTRQVIQRASSNSRRSTTPVSNKQMMITVQRNASTHYILLPTANNSSTLGVQSGRKDLACHGSVAVRATQQHTRFCRQVQTTAQHWFCLIAKIRHAMAHLL